MSTKRKTLILGIIISVLLTITAVLLFYRNVGINTPFSSLGNGVISVVFDKAEVLRADKVVLREGEKSLTITDPQQVRAIAEDFMVANSAGLCGYYNDRWIDIYHGEKLVRQIHWNDHDDLATVYRADRTHWLWPHTEAQVSLSKEDAAEYARLYALIS